MFRPTVPDPAVREAVDAQASADRLPTMRRPGLRRWWLLAVVAGVVLALLILRLFVFPSAASPGPSDAVVILAGDAQARLPLAVRLAEDGPAVLVVSAVEGEDNEPARRLCRDPGDLAVHCFAPDGSDTRAEARALGRIVAEHGWTRVTVVTSTYHVTRAGLLVRRCTDAEVQMADARAPMPIRRWGAAVVGEIGGLLAAAVDRSC